MGANERSNLYRLIKDEQLPFVTFRLDENAPIVFEGN